MAYAFLTDLLRQVANVLKPAHGGTGSTYGEARQVIPANNLTGADLAIGTVVEWASRTYRNVQACASLDSDTWVGAVVGYYDQDGVLIEDDAPDGSQVAVQIAGIAEMLLEGTVNAGEYAFVAATDGTIYSDPTLATGAIGTVMHDADTGQGFVTVPVMFPLPGGGGGSGATFATPSLTLSTTNAAGSGSNAIRNNAQIAIFDATVPVTQAFGDSAATGSAAIAARRDHKHGMPANPAASFATPSIALGTAAAAGAAATVIRSDATIAAFDATAPVTQAFGDAAAAGSAAVAARRDHTHGMPSLATPAIVLASSAAAGSAATVIRSDSTIAAFDATVPVTQDFSDAAATGSAAFAARRDHKHGMMALPALDAVGAPSDITTLNASTSAHGLLKKLDNSATHYLDGQGNWSTPNGTPAALWDAEIVKASDEDVSSSTVLQDDNELFFSPTSGKHYIFECILIYSSPVGGATPDLKLALFEDSTFRGWYWVTASGPSGAIGTFSAQLKGDSLAFNTGTSAFVLWIQGTYGPSAGATFKLQWAQNTSSGNATRIHANSRLRYKQLD